MSYVNAVAISSTEIRLTIGGLEYPANQYGEFGAGAYANGSKVKDKYWLSASTSTSTTAVISGLETGTTYNIRGTAKWNGTWYEAGWANGITTDEKTCPDNWEWSYFIYPDMPVYDTISFGSLIIAYIMPYYEWNAFTQRINDFREYKGLSKYSFTTVSSDSDCTPDIINQAVDAINDMGFSINRVSHGNVPANVFIQMRKELNSIS